MLLSVKTREHLHRRLALALPHWATLLGAGAALAAAVAFTGQTVRVVTIHDARGTTASLITGVQDTAGLLDHAGLAALDEEDAAVWERAAEGDTLHVLRAYTVEVTADGETRALRTTGATAAELLAQAGIAFDADDKLTPAADATVAPGESVTLQRVETRTFTQEEVQPVRTVEIPTSLFYRCQDYTQWVRTGAEGLDLVTYRETFLDGVLSETAEVGRESVVEMVPGVRRVYGEGVPVSSFVGPELVDGVPATGVAETFTAKRSTGYSASATAKGASGRRLTYGTVAVNPNVIPYGSLMYITSEDGRFVYGYAYAADTGTAMMTGHAFIDLYYETYEESVKNAVISVNVYLLDEETAALYQEQNDALLAADSGAGF